MDRIEDHLESDLIDLGAASVETQGAPGVINEPAGLHHFGGLSDE
jgi:hypothetical protein